MSIPFKEIQPLNHQMGFNVNSVQRHTEPLNAQIGFNAIPFKDRFNH